MQPTPPKSKKPGYRRPFYDAGRKTSAEIVSEARNTVKVIETSRPYTPVENNRRLFGSAYRPSDGRPPSVFSIGPSAFTDPMVRSSSRPQTGRLSPLSQAPTRISADANSVMLDSLQISRKFSDASLEDNSRKVPQPPRGSKMNRSSISPNGHSISERRVKSGPKDHSKERRPDQCKQLRKSNSFGTIERDIVSADSGVEGDIIFADSFGQDPGSSSDSFSDYRVSGTSALLSDSNSHRTSISESRLSCKYDSNECTSSVAEDCDSSSLPHDTNIDNKVLAFKDSIEPLLKQMELNYLHSDIEALITNFDVLWKSLEICGLLVKASASGPARRRTAVLRTIFKFVDVDSPIVILKLCKIALAMRVTGKNMVNVCKLIFKISKDKSKDTLFKENKIISDILEVIKTSDISTLHEGIIYAVGSIKFFALNKSLHDEIVNTNCASCFVNLLKDVKELSVDAAKPAHLSHLAVQASAAIRNMADIPNIRVSFIENGLIQILMELLQPFWKDSDYMLNVSRILSKLTQYSDCCSIIGKDTSDLGILVQAMKFHHTRQDIIVRLAFVLGNITGKETETRKELYFKHSSLGVFLSILHEYFNVLQKSNINSGESGKIEDDVEKSNDVLIKVVRVVANMAIDQSVAVNITNNTDFVDIIIKLLQYQSSCEPVEELCINIAAMLNNLSFHASEDSIFTLKSKELTEALFHLLFIDNMDCIIEATRVFGNFTRFKNIRMLLREKKVLHMLITLLESTEREVVFCACGTLINLMVDSESRPVLFAEKGIQKLVDALRDFGQTDWQLSSMICQTLWNYSEKITSAVSCFGEKETEDLIQILQDYTDPEIALDYSANPDVDSETFELMKQIWTEQFENVGVRLLSRLNFYHTDLEPLAQDPNLL